MVYAFDQPAAYLETNIRTVIIHHFFHDQTDVPDKEILTIVQQTLSNHGKSSPSDGFIPAPGMMRKPEGASHYRQWFWELMDYGTYLKQTVGNPNSQAKNYQKQSAFAGSNRQLRGSIIRLLAAKPHSKTELQRLLADERLASVLQALVDERLIVHNEEQDEYTLF